MGYVKGDIQFTKGESQWPFFESIFFQTGTFLSEKKWVFIHILLGGTILSRSVLARRAEWLKRREIVFDEK